MPPDPCHDRHSRPGPDLRRLGAAMVLSALLGACAAPPQPPADRAPPGTAAPKPVPAPAAAAPAPTAPAPVGDGGRAASPPPAAPVPPQVPPTDNGTGAAPALAGLAPSLALPANGNLNPNEATLALLRYADRLRTLTPPELTLEIAALGDPGLQPARQLQLALALVHTNQPVDTARALGLAQRAANNTTPEAAPYKPFARLIAHRLLEQRKLEESVDRQAQQLREQQRRLDLLNERLEAMRAIERSLNNRPPAAAPRPPTP